MTDAIQKAREALLAARDTLSAASRQLTDDHKIGLGRKRWGGATIAKINTALAALDAETEVTPADVGELVERLLHDHVQLGKMTEQASFLASGAVRVNDPSALMADLRDAATALERVTRERDEALKGRDDWKDMFEQAKQKHGYCIVRSNELTDKLSAAEAKLAEALADRAAQAERIRRLEEALTKRIEWHRCSCPEPCDDYGVFPGGCTGRYREDYHKLRAALGGNADA